MLKHNLKAAVNSIQFLLRIIDDKRSFFVKFTINDLSVSVATSNNNRHVTRKDVTNDTMISETVQNLLILNIHQLIELVELYLKHQWQGWSRFLGELGEDLLK